MKTLVLACPGFIWNGGGLNYVAVLPCTYGAGVVPHPDTVAGSVTFVPLVLEQGRSILIV